MNRVPVSEMLLMMFQSAVRSEVRIAGGDEN